MNTAIAFKHLGKTFGRKNNQVRAVRDLDLEIQAGQVYGFLGPNGAGKSTTIRMLMALIRPTTGNAYLFGDDVQEKPATLARVGALVEGASFYNYLTGRENLNVLAQTAGRFNPAEIQSLLEQVGMAKRADRKVSGYSTGMRQRLGIAAALLGSPDLVILDEPTNGLDPAGIQDMRRFIRSLAAEQGKTVFLSSHLLNEVEQVCDRVAIIHHGQLLQEGAVGDLVAAGSRLRIQASPPDQAARVLEDYGSIEIEDEWLVLGALPAESPKILRKLVEANIQVYQAVFEKQSLEDFFMGITQQTREKDE
jgi:ABC-2 type transport system ATP-binding protein